MALKLSILDRSPADSGDSPAQAIANTVSLAQVADELGFHRFWVSEHHGSSILTGSSPEVLVSYLLASTRRIRVGSGGVMLQHYSAFKVAENFNVLATLAPSRVDLGVGRGPGGLPETTSALQGKNSETVPLEDKLVQLIEYVQPLADQPRGESHRLQAQPLPDTPPEVHLLGANVSSAALAASVGIPYVFAHFINGEESNVEEALATYRREFNRATGSYPQIILAISALTAASDALAQSYAEDINQYKVVFEDGASRTINTLAAAELLGNQSAKPFRIEARRASILHGGKASLAAQLHDLRARHDLAEIMVLPAQHSYAARLHLYEALASIIR